MSGPQRMRVPMTLVISDQPKPERRIPKWRKPLPIPRHAHPFVRRVYREMNDQKVTMLEVAAISGLRRQTIWDWANRHPPRVDQLEAALNALGLRLQVVEIEE